MLSQFVFVLKIKIKCSQIHHPLEQHRTSFPPQDCSSPHNTFTHHTTCMVAKQTHAPSDVLSPEISRCCTRGKDGSNAATTLAPSTPRPFPVQHTVSSSRADLINFVHCLHHNFTHHMQCCKQHMHRETCSHVRYPGVAKE